MVQLDALTLWHGFWNIYAHILRASMVDFTIKKKNDIIVVQNGNKQT